jgi:hypothetical protein
MDDDNVYMCAHIRRLPQPGTRLQVKEWEKWSFDNDLEPAARALLLQLSLGRCAVWARATPDREPSRSGPCPSLAVRTQFVVTILGYQFLRRLQTSPIYQLMLLRVHHHGTYCGQARVDKAGPNQWVRSGFFFFFLDLKIRRCELRSRESTFGPVCA